MSGPMGLVYETPGDPSTSDVWGVALNASLTLIEQHDHTLGKGVQVPSAGIGINADLSFASFALKFAKTITFTEIAAAAVVGYADALFVDSATHNLFFRNSGGANVQITSGSTLNISIVGGIGGDYASVNALFSYDDATRRYLAQQEGSPRPWAGFATADVDIYEKALIAGSPASNKVTLKSPHLLAASYSVTWLAALPASQTLMQIDTSGNLLATNTLPNNANITLQGTGHLLRGNRSITVPLRATMSANISGGGATLPSAGAGGAGCPVSSSNTFLCPPGTIDEQLMTVVTVDVYAAVAGGTVVFNLQQGTSAGNYSTIPGATNSSASMAQYTKITLTPTTPFVINTMSGGLHLAINVAPGAGVTTCNVLTAVYNTTVAT